MSETIEVRYIDTKLNAIGQPSLHHKYILYKNNEGTQFYARGGTTVKDGYTGIGFTSPLGKINTDYGEFLPGTKDFPEEGGVHFSELIATGNDLSQAWNDITTGMDLVEGLNTAYWPNRNSNSAVDTALSYAGLSQPINDDRGDLYFSPGSGFLLPIGTVPQPDNSILDHSNNFGDNATDPGNGVTDFGDGLAQDGGNYETNVDSDVLNEDGASNSVASGTVTDDYSPGRGNVGASDSFLGNIVDAFTGFVGGVYDLARNIIDGFGSIITSIFSTILSILNIDPLVLDIDGDGVELISYENSYASFDIDNDGYLETTGWVDGDDALLVHDINGDGIINDITETFSEYYNNPSALYSDGFEALETLDSNFDKVFDANDVAYSSLLIWQDSNEDGQTDAGELITLAAAGIHSIDLAKFLLTRTQIEGNPVFSQSTATINGAVRDVASVDFVSNAFGYEWNDIAEGLQILTEDGQTAMIQIENVTDTTLDLNSLNADSNPSNDAGGILGNLGDDLLIGDSGDNWLIGAQGSDTLQGGAGDDLLVIDADDDMANIDAGDGFDTIQIIDDRSVTLNLTDVNADIAIGGNGSDILYAGGNTNAFIRGGLGDDIIIGGIADDALSGEDGKDYVDGGLGDDVIRGHRGEDLLIGNIGQDYLDGGSGNDVIYGEADDDLLIGGSGNDKLFGGDGFDVAEFKGKRDDYFITVINNNTLRVQDTIDGRDGINILTDVEALNFSDIIDVRPVWENPFATDDIVSISGQGPYHISASSIVSNDIDFQDDSISIRQITSSIGGTATLLANGDVSFAPDTNFQGVKSFSYYVIDSKGFDGRDVYYSTTGQLAETQGTIYLKEDHHPDDPLFYDQWYLNDINILPIWQDYTGEGVSVGVFEAGIPDKDHFDLIDNLDQATLDNDLFVERNHATGTAGIIAASQNGIGGIGIAYNSIVHGNGSENPTFNSETYGLQGYIDLSNEYLYDIANHSIGNPNVFEESYDFSGFSQPSSATLLGSSLGRDGLGTISIWSAGNRRDDGRNTNDDNTNIINDVIVVGGINKEVDLGNIEAQANRFSTPGANILISAPASNIVTTQQLLENSNGSIFGNSYEQVEGTSYAAPIVSGVVALMLEANPNLGYRDVQEILAYSAKTVDDSNTTWQTNGAVNWNGGGLHFSHDYGFGSIDALAAVRMAESWHKQETNSNRAIPNETSISSNTNLTISDLGTLTDTIEIVQKLVLENVIVKLDLVHDQIGDLIIKLISPSGTESILLDRQGVTNDGSNIMGHGAEDKVFYFGTRANFGEISDGTWTLEITDAAGNSTGVLRSWQIDFNSELSGYLNDGEPPASSTYIYTDEYLNQTDVNREFLFDSNNSDFEDDTINLAAITGNVTVDLTPGSTSSLSGKNLQISVETTIERLFTGDGNDNIIGNYRPNLLWGGRGNDIINGADGNDWLFGHTGVNQITGGAGLDRFIIYNGHVGEQRIQDFNSSESDMLYVANYEDIDEFSDLSLVQDGSDTRITMPDGQVVVLVGVVPSSLNASNFIFDSDFRHFEVRLDEKVLNSSDDNYWNSTFSGHVINGLEGNDVIRGSYSGDIIYGGLGNDYLLGSFDLDPQWSNTTETFGGNDVLYGGEGDDQLFGGGMNDELFGGPGSDGLAGNKGNDIIHLDGTGDQAIGGAAGDLELDTFVIHRMSAGDIGEDIIYNFNTGYTKVDLTEFSELSNFDDLSLQTDIINFSDGPADVVRAFVTQGDLTQSLIFYGFTDVLDLSSNDFIFNEFDPIKPKSDVYSLGEDSAITVVKADILSNDGGPSASIPDFSRIVLSPENGTFVETGADSFVYTPDHNFWGQDKIVYEVSDGSGLTATSIVFFNINPVNDNPLTDGDNYTGDQDAQITGNVIINDTDVDGDFLNVIAGTYTTFQGGSVVLSANGDFTYTPVAGFFGVDNFNYTLEDGWGGSDIGNVSLTINEIPGGPNLITGTEGADALVGTGFDDEIYGLGGSDVIEGSLGNDIIDGGNGNDLLSYENISAGIQIDLSNSSAQDTLGAGVDTVGNIRDLRGSNYDDVITGNNSANRVYALDGDDTFEGSRGNDWFYGGDGNDTAIFAADFANYGLTDMGGHLSITDNVGNEGSDKLYDVERLEFNDGFFANGIFTPNTPSGGGAITGTTGNDQLNGTSQDDQMYGLEGNDTLYGSLGADLIDGGAGNDTARYEASSGGIYIDMENNIYGGADAEGDTLVNIKTVFGSHYDDVIRGTSEGNLLNGQGGDDVLIGGDGLDTLKGAGGADRYVFEALSAYNHTDKIRDFKLNDNDVIDISDLMSAYDPINRTLSDFVQITNDGTHSYLEIDADGGADSFLQIAKIENVLGLDATALEASGHIDVIGTNSSANIVSGTAGDDQLNGTIVDDILYGYDGRDTLYGSLGADSMNGGDEKDSLNYSQSPTGVNVNLETGLGSGGHAEGDTFDSIEWVFGSHNDDVIRGSSDGELLNGFGGDDVLIGGDGKDTLKGASGADTYIFESVTAFNDVDNVRGFKTSEGDVIDISDVLIGYDPIGDAIADFVQITDDGQHSYLEVDANGGGNNFQQIARIENTLNVGTVEALELSGHLKTEIV